MLPRSPVYETLFVIDDGVLADEQTAEDMHFLLVSFGLLHRHMLPVAASSALIIGARQELEIAAMAIVWVQAASWIHNEI